MKSPFVRFNASLTDDFAKWEWQHIHRLRGNSPPQQKRPGVSIVCGHVFVSAQPEPEFSDASQSYHLLATEGDQRNQSRSIPSRFSSLR